MNQQDVQWSNLFLYQMIDSGGASTKTINSEEGPTVYAISMKNYKSNLKINGWISLWMSFIYQLKNHFLTDERSEER